MPVGNLTECSLTHFFLQPLPDFTRIPGLTLSSRAFSDCLTIMEFLHSFGKVLGFDLTKDVPSLGVLQEGLLCQGDSLGKVQDLLVRLLKAALHDPGLPSHCQVSLAFSLRTLNSRPSPAQSNGDVASSCFWLFVLHLFFSLSLRYSVVVFHLFLVTFP